MKKIIFGVVGIGLLLVFWLSALATRPVSPGQQSSDVKLEADLALGVEDGDENLMFGAIVRIDLDGQGNIYVLDYKYRKISMFGEDGRFVRAIVVPEGQGPQEATNLGGIAVTPGGTIFVNDMRKVIVYGPDGRFVRSFLVDFMISSIGCPGTEDLIAIGPNGGKILHVFDQSGKLRESFGDLFSVPSEFEPMKEMPMFGAPILFSCAKDGRIFVLNPHRYEISIFKDRRFERVLKGDSPLFRPLQRMGRGFVSTAAHIVASGDLVFVVFQNPDLGAKKTADVFRAGKRVGTLGMPGTPHVADLQGRIYVAEEEPFPQVVRYAVIQ